MCKHNSDLFQENDLIFTDDFGNHSTPQALYRAFKLVVCELGMPTVRFYDLRHSYAVVSLKSGNDANAVQTGCRPSSNPQADKGYKKSAFEIQNNLNPKSGKNKKKPQDSGT